MEFLQGISNLYSSWPLLKCLASPVPFLHNSWKGLAELMQCKEADTKSGSRDVISSSYFIYLFFFAEMTQYLGYFWNCTIVNTISVSLFPYADLVKWINTSKGQIVWVLGLHWFYFRVFYVFVLFVCLFSICLLESTKDREESDTFQVHIRRIAESFL